MSGLDGIKLGRYRLHQRLGEGGMSEVYLAHDELLHRDIKPSNILLSDDHYAYLADFGLAKPMDGRDNVTHTGVLMGTPEYMAPELADGHASISSDLYALGILLYQMVTGQLPFTGDTPLAVYMRQMHELPAPPSRLNPAISQDVDQVIQRALDKDPRRRFQTPDDLAQAYLQSMKTPLLDVVSSNTTRVAVSDSGEIPPLYAITGVAESEAGHDSRYALAGSPYSDMQAPYAESVVASLEAAYDDQLVLPVYQFHANSVAQDSGDKTIIERSSSLSRHFPIIGPVIPTKFHDERYNRDR